MIKRDKILYWYILQFEASWWVVSILGIYHNTMQMANFQFPA